MNINTTIQDIINKKPKANHSVSLQTTEVAQCCGHVAIYNFPFDTKFITDHAIDLIVKIRRVLDGWPDQKLFSASLLISRQKTAMHVLRYLASEVIKFKGSTNTNLELYIIHRKDIINKLKGHTDNKGDIGNDPAQI